MSGKECKGLLWGQKEEETENYSEKQSSFSFLVSIAKRIGFNGHVEIEYVPLAP